MEESAPHRCPVVPPASDRPQHLTTGIYFRNLKGDDIALQYTEAQAYGYRLKISSLKRWEWDDPDTNLLSLSVNECTCVGCALCSIQIAEDPSRFVHVWEIDLAGFNAFLNKEDSWIAVHSPVIKKDYNNPCHYCLESLDGTLTKNEIIKAIEYLAERLPPEDFGPGRRKPPPDKVAEASAKSKAYSGVVKIHRLKEKLDRPNALKQETKDADHHEPTVPSSAVEANDTAAVEDR